MFAPEQYGVAQPHIAAGFQIGKAVLELLIGPLCFDSLPFHYHPQVMGIRSMKPQSGISRRKILHTGSQKNLDFGEHRVRMACVVHADVRVVNHYVFQQIGAGPLIQDQSGIKIQIALILIAQVLQVPIQFISHHRQNPSSASNGTFAGNS